MRGITPALRLYLGSRDRKGDFESPPVGLHPAFCLRPDCWQGSWEDQRMQRGDCEENLSWEIAVGEMKTGSGWQR